MKMDTVLFPARNDENDKPICVTQDLWLRIVRAGQANGGIIEDDRYSPVEARLFGNAIEKALKSPQESEVLEPSPSMSRRFGIWGPKPQFLGIELEPDEREVVDAVVELFASGRGVIVEKRIPSALRATL